MSVFDITDFGSKVLPALPTFCEMMSSDDTFVLDVEAGWEAIAADMIGRDDGGARR